MTPSDGSDSILVAHQQKWDAPLPPPDILSRYGEADPSFPDRVMRMAERTLDHQMDAEQKALEDQARINSGLLIQTRIGQIAGLCVAIAGIALAALAILHNQPWAASIIASVDLTGLVAVFVIGSRRGG